MKPQPHRNPDNHRNTGSAPLEHHSIRERGMHAANPRPPPTVPHRRYPSLSDDGQPYFPNLRRTRWRTDETVTVANPPAESDRSPLLSVRTIALLALIVVFAILAATA